MRAPLVLAAVLALAGCDWGAASPEGVLFWVGDEPFTEAMRDHRPDAAVVRDALGLAPLEPLPEDEARELETLMLNQALAWRRARLMGWERGVLPWPPADAVARIAQSWGPASLLDDAEARAAFLARHGLTEEQLREHVESLLVESAVLEIFFEVHEGDVTRCLEENTEDLQAQWDRESAGLPEDDRPDGYSENWARHTCSVAIEQRRRASEDYLVRVREAIAEGALVRRP